MWHGWKFELVEILVKALAAGLIMFGVLVMLYGGLPCCSSPDPQVCKELRDAAQR